MLCEMAQSGLSPQLDTADRSPQTIHCWLSHFISFMLFLPFLLSLSIFLYSLSLFLFVSHPLFPTQCPFLYYLPPSLPLPVFLIPLLSFNHFLFLAITFVSLSLDILISISLSHFVSCLSFSHLISLSCFLSDKIYAWPPTPIHTCTPTHALVHTSPSLFPSILSGSLPAPGVLARCPPSLEEHS